jgi:hypothetical protein
MFSRFGESRRQSNKSVKQESTQQGQQRQERESNNPTTTSNHAQSYRSVLLAAWQNVLSWFVRTFVPSRLPRLLPKCSQEDSDTSTLFAQSITSITSSTTSTTPRTTCISIGRPGGVEQLRVVRLKPDIMTCGYNVPGQDLPFTKAIRLLPTCLPTASSCATKRSR